MSGKIYYGIKTGLNEAFVIDEVTRAQLIAEDPKSAELIKPFLAGRDIKRYEKPNGNKYLILMPRGWTREQSSNAKDALGWLKENYQAIANHLLPFSEMAEKRCDKGEYWWELRACDYYYEFEKPKTMLPDISIRGNFIIDETGGVYSANTTYIICSADKSLMGLLNSSLMDFYYRNLTAVFRGGYLRFFTQYLIQLPIRTIDFSDPADVARHDRMVSLVEQMLALHKQLLEARTPHEKTALQRRIEATDGQIDDLVYELYGLTEEEIGIVQKASK
ncbi:MAG: TaqI-like C-terminal specificity domain-containing protein [Methanothrix sp.]|nr:TaqI-like C-terminal specificity domain-containing protein [Methanothrix sp.]